MGIDILKSYSTLKLYKKNEYIYNCNTFDGFIYYLEDGLVLLSMLNVSGMEKTLIVIRPKNFFGENSFGDKPHLCMAKTLTDSRIWRFTKEKWLQAVQEDPSIALFTVNSMAKRIRYLNYEVTLMSFSNAVGKLGFVLYSLFNQLNITKKDNLPCIDVTHDELAKMAGLCRVTVTKTINYFKDERIIKTMGRWLVLINPQKLADIVTDTP
ncbi:MAG: Crp/Fnr family transcriptional regulator [Bacillota bacterium]